MFNFKKSKKETEKPQTEEQYSGTVKVTLHLDGEAHEFESDTDSTILDAALDEGIDPPYSCMAAACTTCMAMLEKGKVTMEDDDVLTSQEKQEGYILTCMAKPCTKEVVVRIKD